MPISLFETRTVCTRHSRLFSCLGKQHEVVHESRCVLFSPFSSKLDFAILRTRLGGNGREHTKRRSVTSRRCCSISFVTSYSHQALRQKDTSSLKVGGKPEFEWYFKEFKEGIVW